jgi:branched-chain amino acid transport system ATP-binding protein
MRLEVTGLRRSFGALRAVDGVDLALAAGARDALIGPNGAGKSTLFRLIAGNLAPSGGRIVFDGADVTAASEERRARLGIGQTFQHSSLFLSMTAAENVAIGARRASGPLRARVDALLAEVGLEGRAAAPAATLAHGERRQLEIAVALAARPRLLLLDEPFAGMSAAERERTAALVQRLPAEVTVLFVEHDLDLVFRIARRVTVLHLGRVLASGTPEEVRLSPAVQEAYLGSGRREELFVT